MSTSNRHPQLPTMTTSAGDRTMRSDIPCSSPSNPKLADSDIQEFHYALAILQLLSLCLSATAFGIKHSPDAEIHLDIIIVKVFKQMTSPSKAVTSCHLCTITSSAPYEYQSSVYNCKKILYTMNKSKPRYTASVQI